MNKLVKEHLFKNHEAIENDTKDEKAGAHYKAKLEEIVEMSEELYSELPEGDLPVWVGDKIVVAKEYLYAVKSWLHSVEEKVEGETMGANRKMDNHKYFDENDEDYTFNEPQIKPFRKIMR